MCAGKTRARPRGHAPGATEGTLVRFIAGNIHFNQCTRWNIEFQASATPIDQRTGRYGESAFLFHHANRLARRAASSPNVLNHQHALAWLQLKAAPQRHLAGTIAFNEECSHSQSACNLVSNQDASERRGHNASNRVVAKNFAQRTAQRFSMLWELKYERALNVRAAVSAARKFEMALADGAHLCKQLENFVARHRMVGRRTPRDARVVPVRVA